MDCRGITFAELTNGQRLELSRVLTNATAYTGTDILNLTQRDLLLPRRESITKHFDTRTGMVDFNMLYSVISRGKSWNRFECLPDDIEVTVRNKAYDSSWHPEIDAFTVEFRPNNDIWIDMSDSILNRQDIESRMYFSKIWIARDEGHARVLRNAYHSTRSGDKISIMFPHERICDSEDGSVAFDFLRTR